MKPYRSLLFVPGHKPDWAAKAVRAGADAVILDLEDSVPEDRKADARDAVAGTVDWLATHSPATGVLVRPNPLDTPHYGKDLAAVVRPGLDGLLLPKVYGPREVQDFAAVVTYLEMENGVGPGRVGLLPTLETARSLVACEAIASADHRVLSLMTAAARDGDVAREVGFTWSPGGLETLYYRSRAVLACRAAGLTHPICGLWQEVSDLDGLERFAAANRALGYGGQVLIHPAHVPVVNRVYTPDRGVVERYRRMIAAFEQARADGSAACLFEGEHVDIAHVKTARDIVAMADSWKETS